MSLRVLLVEPYFTGSHRAWADGYRRFSSHDVALVTHEGRFWKWRMHGGFLTLAAEVDRHISEHGAPDVLLISDMVHLPALLGATRRSTAGVPVALYMHENQLTYPPVPGEAPDLSYPMVNWTSMAIADAVLFNSAFHRDVWFDELPRLLKHFPDYTHTHLIDEVYARSTVLPVGVDLARVDRAEPLEPGPPLILWNQRWEYDKGPDEFIAALDHLAEQDLDFRIAFAGETFSNEPGRFEAAAERLGGRVVHLGFAPEERYRRLLRSADIVVSTARQEFFGISVVEAMYAGAFPLLPARLSYPELVPGSLHDRCLYGDFNDLIDKLTLAVAGSEALDLGGTLTEAMRRFDWSVQGPEYDRLLASLVEMRPGSSPTQS